MTTTAAVPRLTLGLPVYNGERFLAASLDALLAQTYSDFELIISDNGSTDKTPEIAQHYAAIDHRVRYVRHPRNLGSSFNHNFVIEQARGEFFKWASDDDLYAPDLLRRCIEALDSRPEISLAHAWTAFIDDAGKIINPIDYALTTDVPDAVTRFRSVLYADGGDDIYGVIRMSVLRQVAPFGSYHWSDRTFVAELALHGPFDNVPDFLYLRRDHAMRTSRIGRNNIRLRCARLDPARGNRWRHPLVRLMGEYLLGYLGAIWRAPLAPAERLRCGKELVLWIADHANPRRRRQPLQSQDQVVEDSHLAERMTAAGLSSEVSVDGHEVAAVGGHEEQYSLRIGRSVRKLAFYGYLGSGNIGNDASLETVMTWLKLVYPGVEVECVTNAPREVAGRYGVRSVPMVWHSPDRGGHRLRETPARFLGRLLDAPRSYVVAGSVDAVLVPGMGVLEETPGVRPWGLPLSLFLIAAACRLRNRPFVLLDVGAEWAFNPLTRWLFVATVRLATHVSYRDSSSAAAMIRAGAPASPEAIAPDLAFAHPAATAAKPEPGRLLLGVMTYYGRKDDSIRDRDIRRKYVATMANAMGQLVDAGERVVLVGGDRIDIDVARDIRAAVLTMCPGRPDQAIVIREFKTFTELTQEMKRAEVVIASRFHNLICALRLARPTVSIGYAGKNRHLMESLGLDKYCQEIERLDATELVAQVRAAREKSEALTAQIRSGTSNYAEEVQSLLARVATEALGLPAPAVAEDDKEDVWYGT
jgi:polysaccharide pyruvyl transferase WcaK-like protein/glycosyltransferase involved in cell wall biosynthesis